MNAPAPLEIRKCQSGNELQQCVQLQFEVWGFDPLDVVPVRMFTVAQKVGGQVIGAFDTENDRLAGFAMSVPGFLPVKMPGQPPRPYLHSHMLAVHPAYRDRGLGRRLKLAQREEALEREIHLMEWTFDPLEIKNAYLNIHKLGAVVRRYTPNFYGVSSSRLQGGLPTDRLHAEWHMNSARVRQAARDYRVHGPQPLETLLVPAEIGVWKSSNPARAAAVQSELRESFQRAFARGLAVTGYRRDHQGNGVYELSSWPLPEETV